MSQFKKWCLLLLLFGLLCGCSSPAIDNGPFPPDQEFLPLGSVVQLSDSDIKLVIVGYGATQIDAEEGLVWDYSACQYPQGVLNPEQLYMFNHTMIETVWHRGYDAAEFKEFLPTIHQALDDKN